MGRSSARRAGAAFLLDSMAFTQDDLDRLERAISQNTTSVTFADGRQVHFSTFDELIARWNFVRRQLGLDGGRERLLSQFRKGVVP